MPGRLCGDDPVETMKEAAEKSAVVAAVAGPVAFVWCLQRVFVIFRVPPGPRPFSVLSFPFTLF